MIPSAPVPIPREIVEESVLIRLAQAYASVARQLERKTRCSETRGYILAALRGGAALNQNQIAVFLRMDRTVVHRAVKSLVREGLLSEKKAARGRALLLHLTPRGFKFRARLIHARRAADAALRKSLSPRDRASLLRLLQLVASTEL